MLKPCSRQLLINSVLGLMLAVANEEGSDRGTEKHIRRKNLPAVLLLLTELFIDRKACCLFCQHGWVCFSVSVWSGGSVFGQLVVCSLCCQDQPPCKWCRTEHKYLLSLETKLLTTEWNNFSAFDGFSCKDWAVTNQYCTSWLEICWANYYTNCPKALNSSWA